MTPEKNPTISTEEILKHITEVPQTTHRIAQKCGYHWKTVAGRLEKCRDAGLIDGDTSFGKKKNIYLWWKKR